MQTIIIIKTYARVLMKQLFRITECFVLMPFMIIFCLGKFRSFVWRLTMSLNQATLKVGDGASDVRHLDTEALQLSTSTTLQKNAFQIFDREPSDETYFNKERRHEGLCRDTQHAPGKSHRNSWFLNNSCGTSHIPYHFDEIDVCTCILMNVQQFFLRIYNSVTN